MDFRFNKEQEALRNEVRQLLTQHPPEAFSLQQEDSGFGYGGWSYEFARMMGSQGWISMTWPQRYGGKERPLLELAIVLDELAYAQAPTSATSSSLPMGRTIIEMGSEFLKKEFLPRVAKGETSFFLALSEPQAGSDLLALETRAVADGDDFVVNGQKVWSSNAHLAHYGFLIARTDPTLPRHKGLSMFILDMRLPGITVRPLTNLGGRRYHNEIFLDNVRIPKQYLLGEKNQGFAQMLKTLDVDRFWARFIKPPFCKGVLEKLIAYCKETRRDGTVLAKDPLVRSRLAESATEVEACRLLFYRICWMIQNDLPLTYQTMVAKVMADEMGQRLFNKGMDILGPFSQLGADSRWAPLRGQMHRWYLLSMGHTIAGGTSEILRTNVATMGLGLPRA